MDAEQRYLAITERHRQLSQQRAVLEAREEDKTKRREELKTQLRAMGVDPDKPEEELARLERETEDLLAEAERELDQFEKALTNGASKEVMPNEPRTNATTETGQIETRPLQDITKTSVGAFNPLDAGFNLVEDVDIG